MVQARFLLEGWGMDDPIAAKALNTLAASDAAKTIAHLLYPPDEPHQIKVAKHCFIDTERHRDVRRQTSYRPR